MANKIITYKLYKYKMVYLYNGSEKIRTTCSGGCCLVY